MKDFDTRVSEDLCVYIYIIIYCYLFPIIVREYYIYIAWQTPGLSNALCLVN